MSARRTPGSRHEPRRRVVDRHRRDLANVNRQLALVSQNVANASTPGLCARDRHADSVDRRRRRAGRAHAARRSGDRHRAAGRAVRPERHRRRRCRRGRAHCRRSTRCRARRARGSDLASLLGKLQDQFSTLLNDPSQPDAAERRWSPPPAPWRRSINALSAAYTAQRQTAQNAIVAEVATLNATLAHHRRAAAADHRRCKAPAEHRRSGEPARRRVGDAVADCST